MRPPAGQRRSANGRAVAFSCGATEPLGRRSSEDRWYSRGCRPGSRHSRWSSRIPPFGPDRTVQHLRILGSVEYDKREGIVVGCDRGGVRLFVCMSAALATLVLTLAGGATASAPPAPANDAFAAAQDLGSLPSGGPISGSNDGATREPGEPKHDGEPSGHSIWYTWHAPDGGPFAIVANGIPGGNTILSVYTGSTLNNLTLEATNDDGGPSKVCVTPPADGTTFHIAIDGYAGATGPTSISWHRSTAADAPCPVSTPAISGPGFPVVGDTDRPGRIVALSVGFVEQGISVVPLHQRLVCADRRCERDGLHALRPTTSVHAFGFRSGLTGLPPQARALRLVSA